MVKRCRHYSIAPTADAIRDDVASPACQVSHRSSFSDLLPLYWVWSRRRMEHLSYLNAHSPPSALFLCSYLPACQPASLHAVTSHCDPHYLPRAPRPPLFKRSTLLARPSPHTCVRLCARKHIPGIQPATPDCRTTTCTVSVSPQSPSLSSPFLAVFTAGCVPRLHRQPPPSLPRTSEGLQ